MHDTDRLYAYLDAIDSQEWAELAHAHIADEGPTGTLARALATAVQLAAEGRQIIPSTHAATPNVADFVLVGEWVKDRPLDSGREVVGHVAPPSPPQAQWYRLGVTSRTMDCHGGDRG